MRYPRNDFSIGDTIMDAIGIILILGMIAGFMIIGMVL